MRASCWRSGILAVVLGAGLGCSRGLVRVEGMVTLDGQPVEGATITFKPQGDIGQPAVALTKKDGSFRLNTSSENGALPGDYKVLVTKIISSPEPTAVGKDPNELMREVLKAQGQVKSFLPALYGDEITTPLRVKVPPDGPVHLKLQSGGS